MIKAISFDLWNTLITSNPAFKDAQLTLFSHFLNIDVLTLSPALHYLDKELDKKAEKTCVQTDFTERINLLAQKLACPLPTGAGKVQDLYDAQASLFLQHLPYESEEKIGKLLTILSTPNAHTLQTPLNKDGVMLFLVSNTGFIAGKTLRLAMDALNIGTQWKLMLFSDEIGYSKPDKRIFAPLLHETGLKSSDILHIGDNFITDYQGARKCGLASQLYTKHLPTFDANVDTINSLWELVKTN